MVIKTIEYCNEDPRDFHCLCKGWSCPACGGALCAGEYLIEKATHQAILQSDNRGDLYGDQAQRPCLHCGVGLWDAAPCSAWY